MLKRTYNFAIGVILLIATLVFFTLPAFFNLDAFIPIIFAIVSFVLAISFFFMGNEEK